MSSSGNPRRGQRRRLLMVWSRGSTAAAQRAEPSVRLAAEYAPAAFPERQPAIATLLPTGLAGFAACVAVVLLGLTAVLAIGLYAPVLEALERTAGPRFARSITALRACVDPRAALSLAGWLSHLLLLAAAVVALVVRLMRRHRRDDYNGRYRAWGWLACLLVGASCATQVPVGAVVGTVIVEATGIALGPSGFGWWAVIGGTALGAVSLWAVLPLHERTTTALWLGAGLVAWAASAAAVWVGEAHGVRPGIAPAAWTAGCGLVTIAMLAAARSVIREVRGETGAAATAKAGRSKQQAMERPVTAAGEASAADEADAAGGWPSEDVSSTDYTDGSEFDEERETRHLSKAERKRLKKLARMSRAA